MARQQSYGSLLREARERRHLDIETVSRRLRIRPDILRAIEQADFVRLPPRGYTKNMISAYARLVGLSSSEITSLYLDEVTLFETGRGRSSATSTPRSNRSGRRPRTPEFGAPSRRSRDDSPQGRSSRNSRSREESYSDRSTSRSLPRSSDRSRGRGATSGAPFTAMYSIGQNGRNASSGNPMRLVFLIGGIALVLVVIIALVVVFGGNRQETNDVPDVPISGLTDTSNPESEEVVQQQQVDQEPTSVKVEYKIANQEIYAEISNNGVMQEDMIQGPVDETVDVTGVWTFGTWVTDAVTVTVDGKEVQFDQYNDEGMPMLTVNFEEILAQWKKDHGVEDGSSSATSASSKASSATSSSSSNSSSSSSKSSTANSAKSSAATAGTSTISASSSRSNNA